MNSVPGLCILRKLGSVNKDVFKYKDGVFDLERLRVIYWAVRSRFNDILEGQGGADNLYVFVKPEPTKISKIKEGRLRLIAGVSLIDSLVDRILMRHIVKKIQDGLGTHPIAVGWSPVVGSHTFHALMGNHDSWFSSDKSHWDWSLQKWHLDAILTIFKLMVKDPPAWWLKAIEFRFKALFEEPIWEFQDGMRIVQKEPGIMKSGCYLTIWLNSIGQIFLHHLASIQLDIPLDYPFQCLGDDTIQYLPEEYEQAYDDAMKSYGFTTRTQRTKIPEFVGFHIHRHFHVPAYLSKHVFLLRHLDLDADMAASVLASYQLMYANHPTMIKHVRDLIRKRNLPQAFVSDVNLNRIQYP
jgi:hypothetical protein